RIYIDRIAFLCVLASLRAPILFSQAGAADTGLCIEMPQAPRPPPAAAAQAYAADFDSTPAPSEFVFSESAAAPATMRQNLPAHSSNPSRKENSAA
ncbi:MAG TPA: hypothetical protein VHW24_20065, partial [Bryobacteraceae bacterium]|nr:hypothetical protein [Bryobacteraceae bacterium]